MECSHIRLMVERFNECFRFYREVIGLPTTYQPDASGPYAEFALGGDKYLGLFDRATMQEALDRPNAPPAPLSDNRVALCFEVDDVDAEACGSGRAAWRLRSRHGTTSPGACGRRTCVIPLATSS